MLCKTSEFSQNSIYDGVPFWENFKFTCLQLHQKGRHHQCFPVDKLCEDNFFGSFHSTIRPGIFYKIGLLKNFGKLAGETPVPEFFFLKKLHTIKPATSLKKRLQRRCFTVNFAKLLKPPCRTPPVSVSDFNATFLTLRQRKTHIYVFPEILFSIFLSHFMFFTGARNKSI